jgi:hypothetical protein
MRTSDAYSQTQFFLFDNIHRRSLCDMMSLLCVSVVVISDPSSVYCRLTAIGV